MAANYDRFNVMKYCIKYSRSFLFPFNSFNNDYINKENHQYIFKLHNIKEEIYQNEFGKKWLNKIALGIEIIKQFFNDKNITPLIDLFYSELEVIEFDFNI